LPTPRAASCSSSLCSPLEPPPRTANRVGVPRLRARHSAHHPNGLVLPRHRLFVSDEDAPTALLNGTTMATAVDGASGPGGRRCALGLPGPAWRLPLAAMPSGFSPLRHSLAMAYEPGLMFSLSCDRLVAVGIMTHHLERVGHLIWIAEPTFETTPDIDQAEAIDQWRWPVLFPLGAALRRRVVEQIGVIAVPPELRELPLLRSGDRRSGWRTVLDLGAPSGSRVGPPITDPSVPIYQIVNDTMLRERIETGWSPKDIW
jgi:hypothetical protein